MANPITSILSNSWDFLKNIPKFLTEGHVGPFPTHKITKPALWIAGIAAVLGIGKYALDRVQDHNERQALTQAATQEQAQVNAVLYPQTTEYREDFQAREQARREAQAAQGAGLTP